ncbi:MAG: electron transfer flavoprotein subunit alpha/FixB family protein [Chloroflexi bacterium]|nr:electron transfer flavoprotein subunit alpha/FixB family protein [Chloroflexota bacterium]
MMSREILAVLEREDGGTSGVARQLAAMGNRQAEKSGVGLAALLTGYGLAQAAEALAAARLFDNIYLADNACLEDYNPEVYAAALHQALKSIAPGLVLMGDSYRTRETVPAVASRMDVPFLNGCLDIELSGGGLTVIQPRYGGTVWVKSRLEPAPAGTMIGMARTPAAVEVGEKRSSRIQYVPVAVKMDGLRTALVETIREASTGADISRAEVIVAAGRGMGSKENLGLVEALAEALGGAMACSRPVCDLGYMPVCCLVGMSGKSVAPRVYIACGISGAPQHIAGMSGARRIIAINRDSGAPIFRLAHYGVIGDLSKVLPALINEARQRAGTSKKAYELGGSNV